MKKIILLLFLGLTGSLYAQEIKLNVSYVEQGNTEWCSTAAVKCILDYYGKKLPNGNPISQCYIMDEYIRKICNSHGGPNGYGCCVQIPGYPMYLHPCNKGVYLGVFNEKASIKGILMHFGDLPCTGFEGPQNTWYIEQRLTQNNLMVAQWNYYYPSFGEPDAHAVVIHGVKANTVYYMDPAPKPPYGSGGLNDLSWNDFFDNLYNDEYEDPKHWWSLTLELKDCSGRDYPCHCYNMEKDGDEQGIDCGGSCPPCAPPGCFNCQKDPDEEEMDCGGPDCPPCEDVPEEREITSYVQLRPEIMAFNKITAYIFAIIASGEKVSFITEEEGSIILRHGFKAEKGCTFTTKRKDLSGSGRICGKICGKWWIPSSINCNYFEPLNIYDLQYANKIEYEIYDLNGYNLKYRNVKDISYNGTVFLWQPLINTVNVTYRILYDTYHCDDKKRSGYKDFTVIGYTGGNSPPEEPEEPEILNTPQFLSSDNLKIQDEMSTPAFSIIPNPNSGTFQLETNFPLSDIAHLKITDMLGGKVYETKNLTTNTIQLQNTTNGLYFVVIILKDGTVLTQKMMVRR